MGYEGAFGRLDRKEKKKRKRDRAGLRMPKGILPSKRRKVRVR